MLIVIEGLDRTGKSTLGHQLSNAFKLEYRHFDKPQAHPLDEYLRPIEEAPVRAVFDRYHVGEAVWPIIFKRPTEMDPVMHTYIELALKSRGAVLVHAQRPVHEIIHACKVDEEPVDEEQIRLARVLFDTHLRTKKNNLGYVLPTYEWTLGDTARLDTIVKRAKAEATWVDDIHECSTRWVGDPSPDLLLVGDQVGPGSNGWTLPFVPYRNTSGHFLFGELMRHVPLLTRVAVINSNQPDGSPELVDKVWDRMSRPPIVALGNEARARLIRQGLGDVPSVPHPQYVRRFLRKKGPGWYVNEIVKAGGL